MDHGVRGHDRSWELGVESGNYGKERRLVEKEKGGMAEERRKVKGSFKNGDGGMGRKMQETVSCGARQREADVDPVWGPRPQN